MDFALSTIFFLLFLSPGIFFRRFYYTEEFSKQFIKETPFNLLLSTFLPTVMIQGAALLLYDGISVQTVQDITLDDSLDSHHIKEFAAYTLVVNLVSIFLGGLAKKIVRYGKLDRKYKMFRFKNSWHYLFSGEIFSFPKADISLFKNDVRDIELKYVDTMVKTSDGTVIYDGVLVDYELSRDHGLSFIVLKDVKRRFLLDDENQENPSDCYYEVPGHTFIIPYSEIININITYYTMRKDKETGSLYSIQVA